MGAAALAAGLAATAASISPVSAPDHFHHGNELLRAGDEAGAEAAYRRALALEPRDPAFHVNLGAVLASQDRLEEAEVACRKGLQLSPGMARAHLVLAQVWLRGGARKQQDGLRRMARAVSLDPQDADIRYTFGREALRHGRYDEAAVQLRAAVALQPKEARAMDQLGYALSKLERLSEAYEWLSASMALEPKASAAAKLIEVLLWLGDEKEARRVAKASVEEHRLWRYPMQRPTVLYKPELPAKPRWWSHDLPELEGAAAYLSGDAILGELREEYTAVARRRPGGWRHQPERIQRPGVGRWKEWKVLDDRGKPCRKSVFPRTCSLLEGLSRWVSLQWAEFSVLEPGAHIRPHTGPTNDRLTVHLCLADGRSGEAVPGVRFRVGDSAEEEYRNGSLVFLDDSFEHEARHLGDQDRVVLLAQFAHPGAASAGMEPSAYRERTEL